MFGKLAAIFAPSARYNSPFRGANRSPDRTPLPPGDADDHAVEFDTYTRDEILKASRLVSKNVGLAVENHRTMAIYTIGAGLTVRPVSGSKLAQKRALAVWQAFADAPDITGRFDLTEIEKMVCRRLDEDGEVFVLKTRDEFGNPKVQLISAHRIGPWKPGTIDGVRFDPKGRVRDYCYRNAKGVVKWLKAGAVLHIFDAEDPTAVRGVPTMAHATNGLRDELELLEMEMRAVKDNSDIARVITTEDPTLLDNGDFDLGGEEAPEGTPTDPAYVQRVLGGKTVRLNRDEKIESYQSKRPSPTFNGFIDHIRRDSAAGSLPYEFTTRPGDANGAGIRLVVSRADRRFADRQQLLTRRLMKGLWFFVIGDAIDKGTLRATPEWWKIKVGSPRRVTVDAGRESKENRADVLAGLKNLGDHYDELGRDFEEEVEQRARELKLIKEVAEREGLDPRLLFAGMLPGGGK